MNNLNPLFDYNNINKDHLNAAKECAKIAQEFGYDDLSNKILKSFNIVEKKIFDIENSIFYKKAIENNLYPIVQGYIEHEEIKYPYVSISSDIRELDNFINNIKKD